MHTVSTLADAFYSFMAGRNTPGTISYYQRHIKRWIAHVGPVAVDDLRKHHLLTWGKKWHEMQAIQRLFTWAHSVMEIIERNPFKGIRRPRPGQRRRVLTDQEAARVLRAADRDFRAYLLALRESIARPQELRAVMWAHIRWEGDHADMASALRAGDAYFRLWDYKSRERRADPDTPRDIFINARLGRLLARRAAHGPDGQSHIFTNQRKLAWTSNAIRLRMRRLCRRLHLAEDDRGERVVAYTWRHTSATNASVNGMPDRVLAELMGHTSTRTTARYQHPTRQHLRKALNAARNRGRST